MIDKSTVNILLVDDDPFVLKLHARVLKNLGFNFITACESGPEGLEHLDYLGSPPNLILLDLNMPGMDGLEFIRHLVERGYPGSLILLSGEDERVLQAAEKLVRAHQIKMLGHMRKPVKPDELERLLQKFGSGSENLVSDAQKIYSSADIRRAINEGELLNYYQPMVSLTTGQVVGAETLARWQHPSDGLIMPDQFIGVAEENGLIRDLTRAVVSKALVQARFWQDETDLALQTAINVSMDDFGALDFVDYVASQAEAAGVLPQHITLEVTESRIMHDERTTLEVLTRLRLKRFRVSIDDFGTGHSSLAQLRDIPFDELKVDRGFVHGSWKDETIRAIFDASVVLAKQLDMGIVAEGVEDRADWDFVRRSGCDVAQGYFVARPMRPEQFRDWIRDWDERVQDLSIGATQKMRVVPRPRQ